MRSAGSTISGTVSFRFLAFILRSIQYPNFLHSNDLNSQVFCYRIAILLICYYNGNTRLDYVKPGLTLLIRDLLKSQAISFKLDFNSCFPLYADQYLSNLQPHARTHTRTHTLRQLGFACVPLRKNLRLVMRVAPQHHNFDFVHLRLWFYNYFPNAAVQTSTEYKVRHSNTELTFS